MEKITAQIFGTSLNDPVFSHLSDAEKSAIRYEIATGFSHIVLIRDNKGYMAAVLTLEPDALHIREAGGDYARLSRYFDRYITALAKAGNKKRITFCTKKGGTASLGFRRGFDLVPGTENEYYRQVA